MKKLCSKSSLRTLVMAEMLPGAGEGTRHVIEGALFVAGIGLGLISSVISSEINYVVVVPYALLHSHSGLRMPGSNKFLYSVK
jgi:hypothetical protein